MAQVSEAGRSPYRLEVKNLSCEQLCFLVFLTKAPLKTLPALNKRLNFLLSDTM